MQLEKQLEKQEASIKMQLETSMNMQLEKQEASMKMQSERQERQLTSLKEILLERLPQPAST
eukprot:4653055-Heterocapsa_arctica.AAC.1